MVTRNFVAILTFIFTLCLSPIVLAVGTGNKMPECTLNSLTDNQSGGLQQYKGKVVYVDFWASWCGPCAKSFPFLNQMHAQLKDKGLQIIGVNLDENLEDAKGFLAKYPAEFTVMADISKDCAKSFDVKAMPSSYIIDKAGQIQHVHLGFKAGEADELKMMVEKLLNDKVSALSP